MQGDISVKSFHLSCTFFFLVFLLYFMRTASPTPPAITGLAVHTMPSAFGSHSFSPGEVLWF